MKSDYHQPGDLPQSIERVFIIKTNMVLHRAVLAAFWTLIETFDDSVKVLLDTRPIQERKHFWQKKQVGVEIELKLIGSPLAVSKAVFRIELLSIELAKLV